MAILNDLLVNGVSRFIGKIYGNLHGNVTVPICECTTAAGTAAKTADCDGFVLEKGAKVLVHFTNANTVAGPTLNINGTGHKAIFRYGATAVSNSVATSWPAGAMISLTYNGSYWFMDNWTNTDTNTHYTTHLYAGTGTAANAATGSPKITVTDDSTVRNSVSIKAEGDYLATTSDASGNITIRQLYKDPPLIDGVYCGTLEGDETLDGIAVPRKGYEVNRYAVCSTAAGTAAKTATMQNGELLIASDNPGTRVTVKFTNKNTANSPTLKIGDDSAKNIYHNGAQITSGSNKGMLYGVCDFVYDGTGWCLVGNYVDSNTTYTNESLGQGYGTCDTAAATAAKVVTLSNYALVKGGIVSVRFTYDVPASATMNINSKGAKNIRYNNANIVAGIVEAGDTATFIYDGTYYHLIAIDKCAVLSNSTCTKNVSGGTQGANEVYKKGNIASLTMVITGLNVVANATKLFTIPSGYHPAYAFSAYVDGVLSSDATRIQPVMCSFATDGSVTVTQSNSVNLTQIHIRNFVYII